MNSDGFNLEVENLHKYSTEFFDLYVITQGGAIRKTALPLDFYPYAIWAMHPYTDVDPKFFDKAACDEANRSGCGYAEAMFNVLDKYNREGVFDRFGEAYDKDKSEFELWRDAFFKEQDRRERIWREVHDEWRKDLPPVLD